MGLFVHGLEPIKNVNPQQKIVKIQKETLSSFANCFNVIINFSLRYFNYFIDISLERLSTDEELVSVAIIKFLMSMFNFLGVTC